MRAVLGAFLFSGDDVDKPIGVLSGGERARVALARLLLVPANFLLMDEPTNHLDLDSSRDVDRGAQGLRRHAAVRLPQPQLHQPAGDARLGRARRHGVPYPGNLDDYLYHQRQLALAAAGAAKEQHGAEPVQDKALTREGPKAARGRGAPAQERRHRPLRKEVAALEVRIATLEAEQKALEASLADPAIYEDFARARPLMEAHQAGVAELAGLYERWEALQAQLEAAELNPPPGR